MTSPTPLPVPASADVLEKRARRERTARQAAERILEDKSRELYDAHQKLQEAQDALTQKIEKLEIERDRVLTLSRIDLLTKLVNRATFISHLEEVLALPRAAGQHHFLFLIDLRRFKSVNGAVGQHGGDIVLKTVAQRLMDIAWGRNGLAARMGGNEFALSLDMDPGEAQNFADYVRSSIEAPMDVLGRRIRPNAVVGAAGTNVAEARADALRGAADYALFKVRSGQAGGRVCVFDLSLQEEIVRQLDLEVMFRRALGSQAIEPWFQPVVDPRKPEQMSFEVLARWPRPDGFIPPDTFIPLASKTGLRRQLDAHLFLTACELAMPWLEAGWLGTLGFNVPPSDLVLPSFIEDLDGLLETTRMPREHMVMEITESVFIDDMDLARERLIQIRQRGVRIALDDFGTGYSNLRSLVGLPLSKIKLDRSLVSDLDTNDRIAMLVSTITQWARAVDIGIVAEGVECESQLTVLKALGCTELQGYHFGKAMPASEVHARYTQQFETRKSA